MRVDVPVLGTITLPPVDDLAYYGGLTALAVLGLMEWPIGWPSERVIFWRTTITAGWRKN